MARLEVRFKDGSTDGWGLHEAFDLNELARVLTKSTGTSKTVSFGVLPANEGGSADFGFVGLQMSEVVSWEIKGMFDAATGAALWAELQGSDEEPLDE
jgi:hypothetical protein